MHSIVEDTDRGPDVQSWVAWGVDEVEPGLCRVSLTCDDVDGDDPDERDEAWRRVLSGLKTVLETGRALRA
jgi:hypothetical protein